MQFYKNKACSRINTVLVIIYVGTFIFVFSWMDRNNKVYFTIKQPQTQKFHKDNNSLYITIKPLKPDEVPHHTSIFFLETSRRPEKTAKITFRQACSIESAARISPDRLVYVLILSPMLEVRNDLKAVISILTHYKNIRLRHIDLYTYTDNTPLQDFVRSGIMEGGKWPVEQHSDMLRIVTLWKFGGIYLDLDVVSLKPLPLINFMGAEYPDSTVCNCIIGLQSKNIAEKAMHMFIKGWSPKIWNKNGPQLFTDLLKELCGINEVKNMYNKTAECKNFTVYPTPVFFPIKMGEYRYFFDPSKRQLIKERIKNSMAVHFWNDISYKEIVKINKDMPYEDIANEYCPIVLDTVIDEF